jgi:thiol:disulfide interchange protein DsbD
MNEDIGFPTSFNFNQNPLVELVPNKPEAKTRATEKVIGGVELRYYKDQVEFVQTVRVKGDAKINISGKIDYMACTDSHCLPPSARRFSLSLE